jgi:hypothetical protein
MSNPLSSNDSEDSFDSDELYCEFCDRPFTTALDCSVHEKTCKAKNVKSRIVKSTTTKISQICHICGRSGHLPKDCKVTRSEY